MKALVAALGALVICSTLYVCAADLTESDVTSKWSYPYTAPADKEKRIRDGVEVLLKGQRGTPVTRFLEVLGPADEITDMSKGSKECLCRKTACSCSIANTCPIDWSGT